MSSNPKDDELREASRTPVYRKVKRVAPEQSPVTPCGKEPDPELGHELIRKERYTSAEFMQLEWERIWKKVWLLGALESDLREPGDFVATEIGRESVLIVRQADGGVRAFYNVCLHRGNRLRPPGVRQRRARSSASITTGNTRSTARSSASPISTLSRRARRPAAASRNCLAQPGAASSGSVSTRTSGRCADFLDPVHRHLDPYNFPQDGADARHHGRVELQLEGLGRRVQRELPRAGHPPAADVVPARPRHPDRLLRAAQPLPDPVRHVEPARASSPPAIPDPIKVIMKTRGHGPGRLRRAVSRTSAATCSSGSASTGRRRARTTRRLNDDQLTDDYHYLIFPNVTLNVHADDLMLFRQRPHPSDPDRMFYDIWTFELVPDGHEWPERAAAPAVQARRQVDRTRARPGRGEPARRAGGHAFRGIRWPVDRRAGTAHPAFPQGDRRLRLRAGRQAARRRLNRHARARAQ